MNAKQEQHVLDAMIKIAAAYFFVVGALWGLFPQQVFDWLNMDLPGITLIWHWIGIMIASYGVGLLLARSAIGQNWVLLLTGFITMLFILLVTLPSTLRHTIPAAFGWTVIGSNLICLVPFGLLLHRLASVTPPTLTPAPLSKDLPLDSFRTQTGQSLASLSQEKPVLLVFLPHLGCTFCRETLADLAALRHEISATGVKLALTHMAEEADAQPIFAPYGLDDLPRVSDPKADLYQALGLHRASALDIYGPGTWLRTFRTAFLDGHGMGKVMGDRLQMPGAFLLSRGSVIGGFRHQFIYDHPDYLSIAACAAPAAEEMHL